MKCPFCANEDTQVKDSRPGEDGMAIKRRRFCPSCEARFTTFERVQLRELMVVKRNNERKPFDRDKITRSITLACRKRPVEQEVIDRLVNSIVFELESMGESEIPSTLIGEMVMLKLKEIDQVAYVRFASVYRDFQETSDFQEFIGSLSEKRRRKISV